MQIITNSVYVESVLSNHHVQVVSHAEIFDWYHPELFSARIIDIDALSEGVLAPREVRSNHCRLPIIGISAQPQHAGLRARFIEGGGSYLLESPLHLRELQACLLEVNRRFKALGPTLHLFDGHLIIDTQDKEVTYKGKSIIFTPGEQHVLFDLAENFGTTRSKDCLLTAIYGCKEEVSMDTIIDSHIARLRRKLHSVRPELKGCIETVWGTGYRLVDPATKAKAA